MTSYIIRRLLILPIILLGVTILIFAMLSQLSPGQRVAMYTREVASQENIARLIVQHGLDKPIYVQYFHWLSNVARGNLGFSKTGGEPVFDMFVRLFPATLELALLSTIPLIALGIWLGILAALNHNKWPDQILRVVSIIGTSMPLFVFALLLLMFFAARLRWFPPGDRLSLTNQALVDSAAWRAGWAPVTGMYTLDALLRGNVAVFLDALHHLVLPVTSLAALNCAVLLRVTRSSMLDTLRQDYIRTALSKGLSYRTVVRKHARPNALLPVVTVGGLMLVALLNGAAITETVYNLPGVGKRFVTAAVNLDVVTVLGFVLFEGVILIIGNLVVDILYATIDPRIRLG